MILGHLVTSEAAAKNGMLKYSNIIYVSQHEIRHLATVMLVTKSCWGPYNDDCFKIR